MNKLIPIDICDETKEQLVNARELWNALGSKRQFTDWIKQRIDKYGFIEGEDFTVHKFVNGKAVQIDYILKIDMAKELAMVDGSEKGREIRRYFISCERQLKEMHFKAIEIFNRKSKNRTFRDFANLVAIKGLGGNNLGRWAREEQIVRDWHGNPYEPYRQYIDQGYFEVKEKWNNKAYKNIRTTYITPKGAVWLHKKLIESGYNPKSICEIVLEKEEEKEKKVAFGMTLEQARRLRTQTLIDNDNEMIIKRKESAK